MSKKRILFCASTTSHIKNFHLPYLKSFKELGYEVWVATNKIVTLPYVDKMIELPFSKKYLSVNNIKAVFLLRKLLRKNGFDIISTHTALASGVIRIAIALITDKPRVFCTVHGYLFNEKDTVRKLAFLIVEKICTPVTNVLMVMNHEDYRIAAKYNLYREKLYYINGMGIDLTQFKKYSKEESLSIRMKLKLSEQDFIFLYAAEFSKRKNQSLLIRAFSNICKRYPQMKLILAGDGILLNDCKRLVQRLGTEEQIKFLGFVENIEALYSICNVYVTTSRIEGMPFNVMEAMACGLPIIASKIKGHVELVSHEEIGILFESDDQKELENALMEMFHNIEEEKVVGQAGRKNIDKFRLEIIHQKIMDIYIGNS